MKKVVKEQLTSAFGVTLLSLIIVIIIMIILAFVVLDLTIGEQGIFEYGKKAKVESEISKYIEDVELSRGDVALDNFGRVTLDNLIKRIEEKNIFSGGKITKIDEEKAEAITKEGYVIIITAKDTKYDRTEKVENVPELKEGNIVISIEPQNWTKENVRVSIQNNVDGNYIIKYSLDKQNWITYTQPIEISKNINVFACLENVVGQKSNYTNMKITIIDKLEPENFNPNITSGSKTITINASNVKDAEATEEYGKSGIKEIWYSKDNGNTWQTNEDKTLKSYTYDNLIQNTTYFVKVKVIDNAENETITNSQEIRTSTVTVANGNISISTPIWNSITHKASVTITKESNVSSILQIQYQVVTSLANIEQTGWKTGINVEDLKHNDYVCARLWDGLNGGSYTSLQVKDDVLPTVTIELSATTINPNSNITAIVKLVDNQSGINISDSRWVYTNSNTAIGTDISSYENTFTGTTDEQTITLMKDIPGTYYLHVLAVDNAGNKIEKISNAITVNYPTGTAKLQVGDYVKYDLTNQSYTVATSETGYVSDQVFNTSSYTGLWRVLYNDSMHGLQIISADSVIDLNIKGKIGYNKLVKTLNNVSSKYVNSTYATAGRSVGSNPSLPEGTSSIYSNSKYSFIASMANDMINADTDCSIDYNAMLAAGMTNIGKEYWMASRYIYIDVNGAGFLGTQVNMTGDIESYCLKCVHEIGTEREHEYSKAVRPVITLKSNVLVTSGNGNSTNPYKLGI